MGRETRRMRRGGLGLGGSMGCLVRREVGRTKRWRLWVYTLTMTGGDTGFIGRIEGAGEEETVKMVEGGEIEVGMIGMIGVNRGGRGEVVAHRTAIENAGGTDQSLDLEVGIGRDENGNAKGIVIITGAANRRTIQDARDMIDTPSTTGDDKRTYTTK